MCVVSMIGDHYTEKWKPQWPPQLQQLWPTSFINSVTREEFDRLKREVEEMKALLLRAKKYDEENGEPDCEIDEKMKLVKKVAEAVGVDLSDVLKK